MIDVKLIKKPQGSTTPGIFIGRGLTAHQDISHLLTRAEFEAMFEWVDKAGDGGRYIRTKADFVSCGESAAMGNGEGGEGGIGGGGVGGSGFLGEVVLGNLEPGDVLKWNGQHWYNGRVQTGLDEGALAIYLQEHNYLTSASLDGYATQDWVEQQGYASPEWIAAQGYLTRHQDISHLLTRAEFEEMFERVDKPGGGWYIRTKADFVSCGESAAMGAGDGYEGGVIGGDALNEEQLAAYLTANNYITQANLGNYVTVDGVQTITGGKSFAATNTFFTQRITVDGDFDTGSMIGYPNIMWHVSNRRWTKAVMDTVGDIHFLEGSSSTFDGTHQGLVAAKFVRNGGTASQFLMADGSVDDTQYLYHRRTAEFFNIDSIDAAGGGLYEIWQPAGTQVPNLTDWLKVFDWGANDNGYRVQMATALTLNGSMFFRHKIGNNWYGWREILDSANYAGILDGRYVNKAGDTMTGPLYIAATSSHYVLATQYNTAGAYSNVVWANPAEARVIFGSPNWDTVELETAPTATGVYRRTNGVAHKIWDAGNDGSGSGLDADLLDGLHAGSFIQQLGIGHQTDTHGAYVVLCPAYSGAVTNGGYFYGSVTITRGSAWSYNSKSEIRVQCGGQYTTNQGGYQNLYNNVGIGGLYVITYNGTSYIALYMEPASTMDFWVSGRWSGVTPFLIDAAASGLSVGAAIATTPHINSNALSATKLQAARTIYTNSYNNYRAGDGVEFDGTGDVTLKLPNSICASDWFRSYGSSGWYHQDYGGGIYMIDSSWVRIYNNKGFYSGTGEIRSDARFNRMGYGGDLWNKGQGAYNVAVFNNGYQTPLLLAYHSNAGPDATGTDRLFAIELLNNGAELRFGFGGKERYTFDSNGNFSSAGETAAGSDRRLKSHIEPLTNRGLLKPKRFIKNGQWCLGFIAQEVEEIYPELVRDMGGKEHYLSLCYANITAVQATQINELYVAKDDHEERIKRLEARL